MRDVLEDALGGECAGPYAPEEWAAIEQEVRTEGKRNQCYDHWWIPRPICEWGYDLAADAILPLLEPDESGNVCASTFHERCTAL